MDHYSSSNYSDALDDQPYHFTPAVNPEDVVCPGSDAEETPDEIEQKRQRYEKAAQRCTKGQIPTILSARLKGPFSKESGWINPWRYRPRRKQNQEDWWQPGSEDMLFTRANVMRKAAAHGLGYLTPADALQWCKATAQAEADAINDTNVESGAVIRSVEGDELNDLEKAETIPTVEHSDQVSAKHWQFNSDLAALAEQRDLSTLNYYTNTTQIDVSPERGSKAMKRPAESQWLKEAYISKRARWEGPAIPSPTPLPDVLERDRRRRQLTTWNSSNKVIDGTHYSQQCFSDVQKEGSQRHQLVQTSVRMKDFATQSDLGPPYTLGPDNRPSQLEDRDYTQLEADVDGLQDEAQEKCFRIGSHGSSIKAKRTPINFKDRSYSDLEPDDLIATAARTKATLETSITNLQSSRVQTPRSEPYNLPTLPRCKITPVQNNHEAELEDEDSFITEVAPSSRNLEKFEFRKRKPRFVEQQKSTDQTHKLREDGGTQNTCGFLELGSEDRPMFFKNADKENLCSESPARKHAPARARGAREKQSLENRSIPPESEKLSWGMIEDITETSSSIRAIKTNQFASPPNCKIPTAVTPSMTPNKENTCPATSATKTFPTSSRRKPAKSQIVVRRSEPSQHLDNLSTQSYNTAPPRSFLDSDKLPKLSLNRPLAYDEDTVGLPYEEDANEMDIIQMELSQICPSSSHEDSPGMSQGHSSKGLIYNKYSEKAIETQGFVSTIVEDNASPAPILSQHYEPLETTEPGNLPCTTVLITSQHVFHVDSDVEHLQSPFNTEFGEIESNARIEAKQSIQPEIPGTTNPSRADNEAFFMPDIKLNHNYDGDEQVIGLTSVHTQESEARWEGCGPQSPWVSEGLRELPKYPSDQRGEELPVKERQDRSFDYGTPKRDHKKPMDDRSWEFMEQPCKPLNSGIKPFKDFSTPTPSPERQGVDLENGSMDIQSLVDVAIRNPWVNTSKTVSSRGSNKRVSFGVLPPDEEVEVSQEGARSSSIPRSSPAQAEQNQQDNDYFHDGTTVLSSFRKHFVAVTRARKFNRILPDTRGTQVDSSPDFGAQAEAFIAADREASTEQDWPNAARQVSSRYLKTRSDANNNILTMEHERVVSPIINPLPLSPERRDSNSNSAFAAFNMDSTLR